MTGAVGRRVPVELSHDVRFAGRVRRLAATAAVALGLIWLLATVTLEIAPVIGLGLVGGWALMPIILMASLAWPALRYALVLPAGLVGLGLVGVCLTALPAVPVAGLGWAFVTAGVALGGVMGSWFWYRLMPVPPSLADPFGPGRLRLIRIHVGLIVLGLSLAAIPSAL